MKSPLFAIMLGAVIAAPLSAQVLAGWTFETNNYSTNLTAASSGFLNAEVGAGTASGVHASASTVWSSPTGNGSAKSLSSNNWTAGDYYQFQSSSTGATGVSVSWDQISSSTGPKDFALQYSTNGSTWTTALTYAALVNSSPNTWTAATGVATTSYSYSSSALGNQASLYFRLVNTDALAAGTGNVAAAGTDRVDNFVIAAIPEPSTSALLIGLATLGLVLRRRVVAAFVPAL